MTKGDILERLPNKTQSLAVAKELYPMEGLFNDENLRNAKINGFIEGIDYCRGLLCEREKKIDIDFPILLKFINSHTGRRFLIVSDSVKRKYAKLLKQGYTKENLKTAVINAVSEPYHKENGFKYLTPEFFSRPNTIDRYGFKKVKKKVDTNKTHENY